MLSLTICLVSKQKRVSLTKTIFMGLGEKINKCINTECPCPIL